MSRAKVGSKGSLAVLLVAVFSFGLVGFAFLVWAPAHPLSRPSRVSVLDHLDLHDLQASSSPGPAQTTVIEYEFDEGLEGWSVSRGDTTLHREKGILQVQNQGPGYQDPTVLTVPLEMEASKVTHVRVLIKIEQGEGRPGVQWTRKADQPGMPPVEAQMPLENVVFGQWCNILIPVGEHPEWSGTLLSLSVTPMRFAGIRSEIDRIQLLNIGSVPRRRRIKVGRTTRDGVLLQAPGSVLARGLELNPTRTRLLFELSCPRGEGFSFRVEGTSEDETVVLLSDSVKQEPGEKLHPFEVEVADSLSGRSLDLRFVFEPFAESPPGGSEVALIGPVLELRGPDPAGPNIILISLDTLRADHLGMYGYSKDTSPFLDRLGATGSVFEDVVSQAPETLASTMSLMTGRYPSNHRVFKAAHRLVDDKATIAHHVRGQGYQTAAFVEGGFVESPYGFDLGFDLYHNGEKQPAHKGGDVEGTFSRAKDWITENDDKRFFMFLQTYEIHTPYAPPEKYKKRFVDPNYEGYLRDRVFDDELARKIIDENAEESLTPEDLEYVIALYDAEIAYVDAVLEDFFYFLTTRGRQNDTLVVITSDHGEDLGDHNAVGVHGHTLHRSVTQVPLLITGWTVPADLRIPGRRWVHRVGLIDVAPTILEIAGVPDEARKDMHGQSLRPLLANPQPGELEAVLAERQIFSEDLTNFVRTAVHQGDMKYVHTRGIEKYRRNLVIKNRPGLVKFYTSYEKHALFRTSEDSNEKKNLYGVNPDQDLLWGPRVEKFREWLSRAPQLQRGATSLSASEQDRLKALGYLRDGEEVDPGIKDDDLWTKD